MELFAFLLALGGLIWAFKNSIVLGELKEDQQLLRRELARLNRELQKIEASAEPARDPVPVREAPAPPTPPRPAFPPAARPESQRQPEPARVKSKPAFDWEALIGVKLFSWIAGIALVFAAIFFLKYSVEHGWLGPPMRVAIGLATGIFLLVVCEWKVARRYSVTANALDGAGIAILFATFYAAHSLWNLIGVFPTFGMMALVCVVAVLLSLYHDSVFVALLGLVGGFATPALLATGEDRPIGLFSYLLLLNAGLAWVAYRKRWPYLTVLSAVFTTLYQWGWVIKFMRPDTIPLAMTIFAVFPVLTRVALNFGENEGESSTQSSLFRHTSAISVALPLLFTVYLASMASHGSRHWLLFGFLLLLDAGLAVIAAKRGPEALHLAGGMGTLVTLWAWLQSSYRNAAWPVILLIVGVFVCFYVATGAWVRFKDIGTRAVLAAPLFLVAFPVLASTEPAVSSPGVLFTALFLLASVIAAYSIVRRDPAVHLLAAVFVLATELIWSLKHLRLENLYSAVFIYAAFALFYLCVPILQAAWKPAGDVPAAPSAVQRSFYLALTGHVFLFFVALNATLADPPWPFLLVLGALNVAIGVAALYRRKGELLLAALAASQLLLLLWQVVVEANPWPVAGAISPVIVAGMGAAQFLIGRRFKMTVTEKGGSLLAATCVVASSLGLLVLSVTALLPVAPGVFLLTVALAVLLCFILLVDKIAEWRVLSPLSVIGAAFVVFVWSIRHFTAENWSHEFLFAAAIHALYLGYPLLLGSSLRKSIEPHLAAVLSGVTFFLFARHSLLAGGFDSVIGVLPVAQAGLMGFLLWRLLKLEPPEERALGRLALVAGAVLGFVTIAIPLQLEKEWITIGWALQAAAIAWLSRRIPHKGLVIWTSSLLAAVFARLVLNPAVLTYHPRSSIPVLNWYLYTYLVAAASFFVTAWLLKTQKRLWDISPAVGGLASAGGVVLLFLLLNIEIADYYSVGPNLAFNFSAGLAQDLTYTIGWGLFAFGLLIAGILLVNKPGRIAAIALLSVTVAKCFLHDLWQLGGLYRVGSFVGLAVCLTLVALLLQRFVLQTAKLPGASPSLHEAE